MDKVYLHCASTTSFKFPTNRLMALEGQAPKGALVHPPKEDTGSKWCLVVFKNGTKTGTTIGKVNVSFTRNSFAGEYQESREWPVIPTDKTSGTFSTKGDPGFCVADTLAVSVVSSLAVLAPPNPPM